MIVKGAVSVAKNIGRQLSFQKRRKKPAAPVSADAVRVVRTTSAKALTVEIQLVGYILPVELKPALRDTA